LIKPKFKIKPTTGYWGFHDFPVSSSSVIYHSPYTIQSLPNQSFIIIISYDAMQPMRLIKHD